MGCPPLAAAGGWAEPPACRWYSLSGGGGCLLRHAPLGARLTHAVLTTPGPVEQLGVLATLSRWRSRVQIPSGPRRPVPVTHGRCRRAAQGQVAQSVRASA